MNHGINPILPDHRDYSFPATFGSTFFPELPDEYSCDAGFGFPDQNADGLPYGCSGYAQSELCQDEDKAQYKPNYTYDKTRFMEGHEGEQVGCDLRDSLRSTVVYGVQAPNETTDQDAELHRRGAYYNVEDATGEDSFDDVRLALWTNRLSRRSVSVGTPWFLEWAVPNNGNLHDFTYDGNPAHYSWHNWKVCGWKTINGEPYLIGKTWQGPNWGDHGWCYISRDIFNRVMEIRGTAAYTLAPYDPNNTIVIRLSIIETLLSYYRMLIARLFI